jgi:L-amino acid N-acyltransferase YncA
MIRDAAAPESPARHSGRREPPGGTSSAAPPAGPLRRALRALRDDGLASLRSRLLARLGYRRLIVFERPLDAPISVAAVEAAAGATFATGLLAADELRDYAAFRGLADVAEQASRLAAGHLCFVVRERARIVAAGWATTAAPFSPYLDAPIAAPPGAVYLYDYYTSPDHRGRGLGALVKTAQMTHYRAAGRRLAVSAIVPENRHSIRMAMATGSRPVALQRSVRIGRWRRDFRRPWRDGDRCG